jgi:hypothetical protein
VQNKIPDRHAVDLRTYESRFQAFVRRGAPAKAIASSQLAVSRGP